MTKPKPLMPKPGTDNDTLLLALQENQPDVFWNPNSKLGITAHSRASELRKMGWDIVAVQRWVPEHAKKRQWGYQLLTPRSRWPKPPAGRSTRIVQQGRVVA